MNIEERKVEPHVSTVDKWKAMVSFCSRWNLPDLTMTPSYGDNRVDMSIEGFISCSNSLMVEALDKIIVWSHGYVHGRGYGQNKLDNPEE